MKPIFLGATLCACLLSLSCAQAQPTATARRFDFGAASALQTTYQATDVSGFDAARGFGWIPSAGLLLRDREKPDALRRDLVWGKAPATFRVTGLVPGLYTLRVVSGDASYGDHQTRVTVESAPEMPLLEPQAGEFATLTATIRCGTTCDIKFDSPTQNWAVNALSLEPTTQNLAPTVNKELLANAAAPQTSAQPASWKVSSNDPTKPLLTRFLAQKAPSGFAPTKLSRADYLKLIGEQIDFWKTHQNASGAIIDPYRKEEWQYSTPAYAYAAAALVAWNGRKDLLPSASKAMDWATLRLRQRRAPQWHEDFFPPMLAHALRLLKPHADAASYARWEANLGGLVPENTYRMVPGTSNWNIVALAGESQLRQMGIRAKSSAYVENSLAAQVKEFDPTSGLYLEGPMVYDLFPRMWLSDMLAQGYEGPLGDSARELMRRAALMSLFMQSSAGELPAGGRSAHHQWNEAEQCATFEIYAAQALKNNDPALAGVFKRAARLSLASMRRWVRPSGEMQILKNWVDPAKTHAYETYSGHSQYNLLPTAMLAMAYEYAGATEQIAEKPAPADAGGFAFEVPELHKIFANAGGAYLEIDTAADPHYDATGLIRLHFKGLSPQLGPSDSVLEKPTYQIPANSPKTPNTGIGVSWQDKTGAWRRIGELTKDQIGSARLEIVSQSPQLVAFNVIYSGDLLGVSQITESYRLTPNRVELSTEIANYDGALRYVWPVLADDGRAKSRISIAGNGVRVSQPDSKIAQTFEARGAQSVRVEDELYPNHNGWARLGVAEYPRGGKITLVIAPQGQ